MLFLTTALALSGCEYFRTRTPQDFMRNPFEPSAAEYEQMARGNESRCPPRTEFGGCLPFASMCTGKIINVQRIHLQQPAPPL